MKVTTVMARLSSAHRRKMKESYLRYSMSGNYFAALPDARDGLKPSQRQFFMR